MLLLSNLVFSCIGNLIYAIKNFTVMVCLEPVNKKMRLAQV